MLTSITVDQRHTCAQRYIPHSQSDETVAHIGGQIALATARFGRWADGFGICGQLASPSRCNCIGRC